MLQYGFVAVYSQEYVFPKLDLNNVKLSRDLQFLADCYALPVPPLPVTGKLEKILLVRLTMSCRVDFEKIAREWAKEVDGVKGFSKVPAYLRYTHPVLNPWLQASLLTLALNLMLTQALSRLYHREWERNLRIKASLESEASGIDALKDLLIADADCGR